MVVYNADVIGNNADVEGNQCEKPCGNTLHLGKSPRLRHFKKAVPGVVQHALGITTAAQGHDVLWLQFQRQVEVVDGTRPTVTDVGNNQGMKLKA